MAAFNWNEEAIRILREMTSENKSAAQIGKRLGITRNAVIGKRQRLGIDASSIKRHRPSRVPVAPKPRPVARIAPPAAKPAPIAAEAPSAPAETPGNPMRRLSLMELNACLCKWPVGDPREAGFFFCGRDTGAEISEPYCEEHRRKARAPRVALVAK